MTDFQTYTVKVVGSAAAALALIAFFLFIVIWFINRRIFYPELSWDLTLKGLLNRVSIIKVAPHKSRSADDSANDGYKAVWIMAITVIPLSNAVKPTQDSIFC